MDAWVYLLIITILIILITISLFAWFSYRKMSIPIWIWVLVVLSVILVIATIGMAIYAYMAPPAGESEPKHVISETKQTKQITTTSPSLMDTSRSSTHRTVSQSKRLPTLGSISRRQLSTPVTDELNDRFDQLRNEIRDEVRNEVRNEVRSELREMSPRSSLYDLRNGISDNNFPSALIEPSRVSDSFF